MEVRFRIDQTTPGEGVGGKTRHDLIAGEPITLVAELPVPAPNVTYQWEIIDRVGTSSDFENFAFEGDTITIAAPSTAPFAFLIELRAYINGELAGTPVRRIASCRTPSRGLRLPVFAEGASASARLSARNSAASTDNAEYADLAGTGESGENWRGYAQLLYELTMAVEELEGGGGDGDVVGPETSTDNTVARFNGVSGKLLQGSSLVVDDAGNLSTPGTVNGRVLANDGSKLDNIEAGAQVTSPAHVITALGSAGSDISVNSRKITGPADPSNPQDAATRAFVLSSVASVGEGDVAGPNAASDNAVTRFDGTTGKVLQSSAVTIDDAGNIATSGMVDGRDLSADGTKLDSIEPGAQATSTARVLTALANANAPVGINGQQFVDLADPTDPQHAATKAYVDANAGGGGGGAGDVVGPVSATDNAVARFDATTGKLLQNSAVTIDDAGNITTSGTVDGRDLSADGTKLDAIEPNADVTDEANVRAALAAATTDVGFNAKRLTAIADPVDPQDAATRAYVLANAGGGGGGGGESDGGAAIQLIKHFDFLALPDQAFVAGRNTVDDIPWWTSKFSDASVLAIQSGVGLRWERPAGKATVWFTGSGGSAMPLLWFPLPELPDFNELAETFIQINYTTSGDDVNNSLQLGVMHFTDPATTTTELPTSGPPALARAVRLDRFGGNTRFIGFEGAQTPTYTPVAGQPFYGLLYPQIEFGLRYSPFDGTAAVYALSPGQEPDAGIHLISLGSLASANGAIRPKRLGVHLGIEGIATAVAFTIKSIKIFQGLASASPGTAVVDALSEVTTPISVNTQRITDVADPVLPQDVATRGWALATLGGGPAAAYTGYSITDVAPPGTSWGGFAALATMIDVTQIGMGRSDSDFLFEHAGSYWVGAMINVFASTSFVGFRMRRTSDNAILLQQFTYPGADARTTELGLHGMITVDAGDVVRLEAVYSGTAPSSWSIPGIPIDGATARSVVISIVRIGASPTSEWQRFLDVNLTTEAAFTFVNGDQTWKGLTWKGLNIAAAADQFAIVPGTGLVIDHNATYSDWYMSVDTAPKIYFTLSQIPGFRLGVTKVRVYTQMVSNGDANYEISKTGIECVPFAAGGRRLWSWNVGSNQLLSSEVIDNAGSAGAVNAPDAATARVAMLELDTATLEARFFSKVPTRADSDPNAREFDLSTFRYAARWTPSAGNVSGISQSYPFTTATAANLAVVLGAQTVNTSNNFVATWKRLRVEYKHG